MSERTRASGRPAPRPSIRSRVLRVAHIIHSLGPGGAENVLVELAAASKAAALELVVVALSPADDPLHARALRGLGVPVVELDLGRWDLRAVQRAAKVLRRYRAQLVHTHLKHADLVGAVAARQLGLPTVSTLHVIEHAARPIERIKLSAGLYVRRRVAARTIAVSHAQREWYRDLAGSADDIVVLPNGIADPAPLTEVDRERLRAELGVPPSGALIVSASLMRPEKGHHLLLDAVARLPEQPLLVALAGDGPLRESLGVRVHRDARLRGHVRFLGYRDDVPSLLGAADLMLHTSLADALPTSLIHALAAGVPIVATRVGGIPDIVAGGAGLLVDGDPGEIAAAVQRLLVDSAERDRMGAAGRARFLDRFEARSWVGRLRTVYESVLDETSRF